MARPELILLDVNETLSDMAPVATALEEIGAPGRLAATWFASVLRDGFALTAAGATAPFGEIAEAVLRDLLAPISLDRETDQAVRHVLGAFAGLDVHPDVREGLPALAQTGVRMVTLGNGAAAIAEGLLERAGLASYVERALSVADAGEWKPGRRAYEWAVQACGVEPGQAMLVAVHPWDVDGARRAGLQAAWLNRGGHLYPPYFTPPTIEVAELPVLAGSLR